MTMIKINLLPKTLGERRALRNTAILFGILFVAIVAGMLTFTMKLRADVQKMEADAAAAEEWKAQVERIQAEADTVRAQITPIKQKLDFINAVLVYNDAFPKLYEQLAKWTYEKVCYTSLQCNGASLQMRARVKTLDDLGRFLLNMYRATDLFSSVAISGVPGYPREQGTQQASLGEAVEAAPEFQGSLAGLGAIAAGVVRRPGDDWLEFTVDCTLKQPISPPSPGGAAAAPAAGQPAGMPAPPPMQAPSGQRMPMGTGS